VDNFPTGAQSELLPLLMALRDTSTRTILGLRDILDSASVVKKEWKRKGIYDVMDRYYDRILIYGEKDIFDSVYEYEIPPQVSQKVRFCGYLTATGSVDRLEKEIREELGVDGKLIIATGGGGGDAYPLLSTLIEAVPQIPDSTVVIFGGPLMGEKDRKNLKEQINGDSRIQFYDFVPDFRAYMKAADVVVTMCGYNLAAEIIYHRPRAIVVPRTWRFGEHGNRKARGEEKEQIMRAEMMSKYGIVEMIKPQELSASTLAEKISHALTHSLDKGSNIKISIDGLRQAVGHIQELMGVA